MKKVLTIITMIMLLWAVALPVGATDIKISALPAASDTADADLFPIVQGGVTKRLTMSQLATYLSTGLTSAFAAKDQAMYIGNTGVAINRQAGSLTLSGVSISGDAGTVDGKHASDFQLEMGITGITDTVNTTSSTVVASATAVKAAAALSTGKVTKGTMTSGKYCVANADGVTVDCTAEGSGMTWPSGGAGIPVFNGAGGWSASYDATNTIPFNYLTGVQADMGITAISDSTSTTSSTTAATSTAVKAAYDAAIVRPAAGIAVSDGSAWSSSLTFSTNTSLGSSDTAVSSQKAVKTYVDAAVAAGGGGGTPTDDQLVDVAALTNPGNNYPLIWSSGHIVNAPGALKTWPAGTSAIIWNDGDGNPTTTAQAQTANRVYKSGTGTPSWAALAVTDLPSMSSSDLAGKLSDESGTGVAVFGTSPTIATPDIGGPIYDRGINTTADTGNVNIDGATQSDLNYTWETNGTGKTYTPVITSAPAANKIRYVTVTFGSASTTATLTLTWTNVVQMGTLATSVTAGKRSTYACMVTSVDARCAVVAENY